MTRRSNATSELPRLTGPYRVGRRTMEWVDARRTDPYGRRHERREVPAVVWYPAEPSATATAAAYLPKPWKLHAAIWGVAANRVVTHSVDDAPVAAGTERFPIVLFSPAGWPPYFYAAMLEEIASHGYVVVGLAHSHEMIPMTITTAGRRRWFRNAAIAGALMVSKRPHADDVRDRGAVVDVKATDLRFALDQLVAVDKGSGPLGGRLDLFRVGVFGHSFGGAAAVVACRADPRFVACANLDGGMWRQPELCTVERPCLLLFAEHPEMTQPCATSVEQKMFSSVEWCELDRALHLRAWQALVDSARPGICAQIHGSEHRTFMDWRVLPLRPWSIGRMGAASIDGRTMWGATTRALLALFDEHLREAATPTLDQLAADIPELEVGAPRTLLAPTAA